MKVSVRLFARLREQLGCEQLELELDQEGLQISELIPRLAALHGDAWQQQLSRDNVLCALNRTVVRYGLLRRDHGSIQRAVCAESNRGHAGADRICR